MSIISSTHSGKSRIYNDKLTMLGLVGLDPDKVKHNPDGTIDYDGDVVILHSDLKALPLKFNVVHGDFNCRYCDLTTLEGCPKIVEGDFDCSCNNLRTLAGAPKKVIGNFVCDYCSLTTLEGGPTNVKKTYSCIGNELTNLKGVTRHPKYMFIGDNRIQNTETDVWPYISKHTSVFGWGVQKITVKA